MLASATLPRLEELALTISAVNDLTQMKELGRAVQRHAVGVRRLSFAIADCRNRESLPQDVWQSFTNLEQLMLDNEASIAWILPLLPTRLTTLRLLAFRIRQGAQFQAPF